MTEPFVVSYSKMKQWRFCRQAYYYNHIEKIIPKRKPKPLKMGGIVHSMLEAVSKNQDWTLVLDQVKKEYSKMMDEEKEYYGNLPDDSKRIIVGYNRKWATAKVSYKLI